MCTVLQHCRVCTVLYVHIHTCTYVCTLRPQVEASHTHSVFHEILESAQVQSGTTVVWDLVHFTPQPIQRPYNLTETKVHIYVYIYIYIHEHNAQITNSHIRFAYSTYMHVFEMLLDKTCIKYVCHYMYTISSSVRGERSTKMKHFQC